MVCCYCKVMVLYNGNIINVYVYLRYYLNIKFDCVIYDKKIYVL